MIHNATGALDIVGWSAPAKSIIALTATVVTEVHHQLESRGTVDGVAYHYAVSCRIHIAGRLQWLMG